RTCGHTAATEGSGTMNQGDFSAFPPDSRYLQCVPVAYKVSGFMTIQRDEASLNIGEPGGGGTWRRLWDSEEMELISSVAFLPAAFLSSYAIPVTLAGNPDFACRIRCVRTPLMRLYISVQVRVNTSSLNTNRLARKLPQNNHKLNFDPNT
ncbi:hypothetical protein KUCAC02_006349, partial [Chaenocephalus aceratus]